MSRKSIIIITLEGGEGTALEARAHGKGGKGIFSRKERRSIVGGQYPPSLEEGKSVISREKKIAFRNPFAEKGDGKVLREGGSNY